MSSHSERSKGQPIGHVDTGPGGLRLRHDWRSGDRARIIDLHRQGYLNYDDRFAPPKVERLCDLVGGMIDEAGIGTEPDHRVWFAERVSGSAPDAEQTGNDVEILGCVALVRRGPRRGQLRWLIVLPDARGLGLGRRLVEAVIAHGQALGLEDIYLQTAPGLPESMALYRRYGFETVRESLTEQWHGDGHEIEMVLTLGSGGTSGASNTSSSGG